MRGEFAQRLRDIIRQICAENGLIIIKGIVRANHIHFLIKAPSHYSPAKIMQFLKGKSLFRVEREIPEIKKRYGGGIYGREDIFMQQLEQ